MVDDSKIHAQFVNIALQLTPPLIRNRNIQEAQEAVNLYMHVYDCVIKAALDTQDEEQQQQDPQGTPPPTP